MKARCLTLTLGTAWALFFTGCATQAPFFQYRDTGDPVEDGIHAIENAPAKDRVLWQYRTAAIAMRLHKYDLAESLLDDALASIGGIITNDKAARKARSLFHAESEKRFIGEPYERVMAYYYRGILYWMKGEIDNARACFLSGQFIDGDTENREYAADYVMLDYLDGLVMQKLGNDGSKASDQAEANSRYETLPPYEVDHNLALFVELGIGPRKYATGDYLEELRFRSGKKQAHSAVVRIAGQKLDILPYDDLYYQATTRGGRVMDHILGNKAVFKSNTSAVGDVALLGGALMMTDRNLREAGAAVAAIGLISKIFSASANPTADTRTWDNLPQYLGFKSLKLTPGDHRAEVHFFDDEGNPLKDLNRSITVNVTEQLRNSALFISSKKH
jgi:hypothetical protein